MKVGFIGLGAMGLPMAKRVSAAAQFLAALSRVDLSHNKSEAA